jgi:anti-sigma factor RsiW
VNSARPHVPEEELHAYCDGELSPPQRIEIAEHLLGCLICRSHHAEVGEVRTRASALLALAVPARIRRPAVASAQQRFARRRLPRAMTAAAAAVVGLGVWFSLQPDQVNQPAAQLANNLSVLPSLFGIFGVNDSSAGAIRERALEMAARTSAAPRVLPGRDPIVFAPRLMTPSVDVDPVVANDWVRSSWDDALQVGNGSLARVAGLGVTSVRMHASANGGRPTFMIRQQLPDGRSVWVFEGPVDDITPVHQVLQASGIAMSMLSRTHPDYIGLDGQMTRTVRIVTVVGHLPVDSLNALMGKVKLQ